MIDKSRTQLHPHDLAALLTGRLIFAWASFDFSIKILMIEAFKTVAEPLEDRSGDLEFPIENKSKSRRRKLRRYLLELVGPEDPAVVEYDRQISEVNYLEDFRASFAHAGRIIASYNGDSLKIMLLGLTDWPDREGRVVTSEEIIAAYTALERLEKDVTDTVMRVRRRLLPGILQRIVNRDLRQDRVREEHRRPPSIQSRVE